jgi:uncharacterized phage protein (TIGR01671 family)
MQREIKFRAWDSKDRKWLFGYELPNLGGFSLIGETILMGEFASLPLQKLLEDVVIMQYTGLKDKNGKEIYEGDIIVHERKSRPHSKQAKTADVICKVEWFDGVSDAENKTNPSSFNQQPQFIAHPIDRTSEAGRWGYNWSPFHNCEIIGNIYDNPELLTPTIK